ncbi:hypothetical protein HaLaN_28714 [Haematococcus lacustris]|uniref:Uncharacterized protein n=1 Tax=Haematococcus lacustris TaxID=44745 RepID=A0A6A0ADL5_HAELA|nr:hypothetical protein HaLaN_28714 [Haematococcus lacustris]
MALVSPGAPTAASSCPGAPPPGTASSLALLLQGRRGCAPQPCQGGGKLPGSCHMQGVTSPTPAWHMLVGGEGQQAGRGDVLCPLVPLASLSPGPPCPLALLGSHSSTSSHWSGCPLPVSLCWTLHLQPVRTAAGEALSLLAVMHPAAFPALGPAHGGASSHGAHAPALAAWGCPWGGQDLIHSKSDACWWWPKGLKEGVRVGGRHGSAALEKELEGRGGGWFGSLGKCRFGSAQEHVDSHGALPLT